MPSAQNLFLKKFDGKKIDLLAINTEGFDFEILKMMDLKAMNPEVIIYEEEHFNEKIKEVCKEFLMRLGYSYHSAGRDVHATKTKNYN